MEETTHANQSAIQGLLYSAGTDIGLRREENQDSYGILVEPTFKLFIVADGMGGVQGGAVASRLAISTIEKKIRGLKVVTVDDIVQAIDEANSIIFNKGQSDEKLVGMGTTLVALLFMNRQLFVFNVGDSRGYLIRNNQCQVLTEDHTLVQELMRSGAITADQASHHPVSHMLTRSLGPTESVDVDVYEFEDGPYRHDKFLLCSDGLHNLVTESELAQILSRNSTDDSVQILIDLANERGGTDNITVVLVECGDKYQKQPDDAERTVIARDTQSEMYHETEQIYSDADPVGYKAPPSDGHGLHSTEEIMGIPVRFSPFRYLALIGGFVGGLIVASIYYFSLSTEPSAQMAGRTGAIKLGAEKAPSLASVLNQLHGGAPIRDDIGSPDDEETLQNSLERRKTELQAAIVNYEERITGFNNPIEGDLRAKLETATKRAEDAKTKLSQVKSDLDLATRKLAVWFGRLKRLESTDAVNMASEIAPSIPVVRQRKEEFERATWDYLKEVEALRYNPSDSSKEARVAELVGIRTTKMKELTSSVRSGIEQMVSDSDHTISELTGQRTKLESEVNMLLVDVEYLRTLMSDDESQKLAYKDTLTHRLEAAKAELAELQKLH